MSFLEKRTESLFGRTIHEHGLIQENDRIMVGLSGGKDSLSLVRLLARRRQKVPIDFRLHATVVDLGFSGFDPAPLERFCLGLDVGFLLVKADWSPQDMDSCYPCARSRRRLLLETAVELGCNKVALGHNLDDLIESHFMGLIYNGKAETMSPSQEFAAGDLTVIRPLLAVPAHSLARLAREKGMPVWENPCPKVKTSARAKVRENLRGLLRLHPKARENLLRGLSPENGKHIPETEDQ